LAWSGLWPAAPQQQIPADPRIAQVATAVPELQTVAGTLQDELATLTSRVSTLETDLADAPAAPEAADNGAWQAAVEDLSNRIEAIAAQPAPQVDTGASEAIAALEAELAALREEVEAGAAQLAETQGAVATLSESADAAAVAETGAAQLPLILSGLESAFDSGRPYDTELAALRTALPDADVPEAIADRASAGLPRASQVGQRLAVLVPDMLAGRPIDTAGNWQGATLDWFRGVVAMRPTGEVEGDTPDAILARLEAAVARNDFAAAKTEFDALPETMRAPAADLAGDIAALAEAEAFLDAVRTNALSTEPGA
jgi:hypothetical protein